MSVNILIMTQEEIGAALLSSAIITYGNLPIEIKAIPVSSDCEPADLVTQLAKDLQSLHATDGILILTDMFGTTSCNVAENLQKALPEQAIAIAAGLNLPMLYRVINYCNLPLAELTEKAVSGGREGVIKIIASRTGSDPTSD